MAVDAISGVLTRRPYGAQHVLQHIDPADRAYVAAEMTAFLLAWLSGLRCPVLNRPSPQCLAGPGWRRERWISTATRLGIPVHAVQRNVSPTDERHQQPEADGATVTVAGDHCFGCVDEALARASRRLADAAGVDLLAVHWASTEASSASLFMTKGP